MRNPSRSRVVRRESVQPEDPFSCAREALRPDKSLRDPQLREAATLLGEGQLDIAEALLHGFIKKNPRDADGLHLMAEAARRQDRQEDAEAYLARAVALAPDLQSVRFNYADPLLQLNKT